LGGAGVETGTPLGPYQIVAAIGAGGMGEAYRARDTRLNRDVPIRFPANAVIDSRRPQLV
jgi:serine/threonine protein kinase